MTVADLEAALQQARERRRAAGKALADKLSEGGSEDYQRAWDAVLEAERALAAAKGESYAVAIDLPAWDGGSPSPHLLKNDYQTFLIYILRDPLPTPLVGTATQEHAENLALLIFEHCICSRMGTPNDEVFHGHPLFGKGFEGYRPMKVVNSAWIKELEAINAVHAGYRPQSWLEFQHYILPFHDSTFEGVARAVKVEYHVKPLTDLLRETCLRL